VDELTKAVGTRRSERNPEDGRREEAICKTGNRMQQLLEALQCAAVPHFADAVAFAASAGVSLTMKTMWRWVTFAPLSIGCGSYNFD
jgi:hypothetical protein